MTETTLTAEDITAQFNRDGYILLKHAISPEAVYLFTQYALFDEVQNPRPDEWTRGSATTLAQARYGDPFMETFLVTLHPLIEEVTGRTLFPTYSFHRVYHEGNDLASHTDRESCEISASIAFGRNYADDECVWPLFIGGTPVIMEPGDMVVYLGSIPHWRTEFAPPRPAWHVQGFIHYVDADGPFADWKFDRRPNLGHPRVST